jgi:hypothetical protein
MQLISISYREDTQSGAITTTELNTMQILPQTKAYGLETMMKMYAQANTKTCPENTSNL